jgi:hypothetical protein
MRIITIIVFTIFALFTAIKAFILIAKVAMLKIIIYSAS